MRAVSLPLIVGCMLAPGAGSPVPASRPDRVVLTRGIVGGIDGPIIRLQAVFTRRGGGYDVHLMERPRGPWFEARYSWGRLSGRQAGAISRALQEVWALPVEEPRGSEDVYGQDVGLAVRAGTKIWFNSAPADCFHFVSVVRPSDEQRRRFREIVGRVRRTAVRAARVEIDAESYRRALQEARQDIPAVRGAAGQASRTWPASTSTRSSSVTVGE